jgi:hypothetical protein
MNVQDFLRNLHTKWKRENLLLEVDGNRDIQEYECYFRLRINANQTDKTLEDILVYVRGINGVTIVRSGETTKRNEANMYSTRLHIKYTPQTFNKSVSLDDIYQFLEKEIRKFSSAISLTRLSPPPGELVVVKGKKGR